MSREVLEALIATHCPRARLRGLPPTHPGWWEVECDDPDGPGSVVIGVGPTREEAFADARSRTAREHWAHGVDWYAGQVKGEAMQFDLVVTRHAGLVEYLRNRGLIGPETPVLGHATAEDVRGRRVIGVLPMHLAAEAEVVGEVPLTLRPEDRGRELTAEETADRAGPLTVYTVRRVAVGDQP